MEKTIIRKVKPTDLVQIFTLEQSSFKHPYSQFYLAALVELNSEKFFVAEAEHKIIGYAVATLEGNTGHIISIAVHQEYRNRKIGTKLMLNLIEQLTVSGASTIRLEVQKDNIAAHKMYQKLGFQAAHMLKNYYAKGEDGILMIKHLRVESHD